MREGELCELECSDWTLIHVYLKSLYLSLPVPFIGL